MGKGLEKRHDFESIAESANSGKWRCTKAKQPNLPIPFLMKTTQLTYPYRVKLAERACLSSTAFLRQNGKTHDDTVDAWYSAPLWIYKTLLIARKNMKNYLSIGARFCPSTLWLPRCSTCNESFYSALRDSRWFGVLIVISLCRYRYSTLNFCSIMQFFLFQGFMKKLSLISFKCVFCSQDHCCFVSRV